MEQFIEAAVKIGGEVAFVGIAVYTGIKKAWPVCVMAGAAAVFFIDEALKAA
jgi:hypothetical protein